MSGTHSPFIFPINHNHVQFKAVPGLFPWNERVSLFMNIIGHESQWFPAMPSIINTADWSADRAASLQWDSCHEFHWPSITVSSEKRLPLTPLQGISIGFLKFPSYWCHKYTSNQLTKSNAASPWAYTAFKSQIRLSDLCIKLAPSGKPAVSSPALRSHGKSIFTILFMGNRHRFTHLKMWFCFLSSDTQKVLPPSC